MKSVVAVFQACQRHFRSAGFFIFAGFASASAQAGLYNVSPILVELAPKVRAASVTVTSSQDKDMLLRAELQRWTRNAAGEDVYEPTTDLVVTPPVFKLSGKGSQLLRVGFLGKPRPYDTEQAYRLSLRELENGVPAEEQEEADPEAFKVVITTLLNINLPVFVKPRVETKQLSAKVRREGENWLLEVENSGTVRQKIYDLRLQPVAGAPLTLKNQFLVTLAGSKGVLPLGPLPELNGQPPSEIRFIEDFNEKTLPLLLQ